MTPAPTPDETQAVISIPHGAAYDWLAWAARACVGFLAAIVGKLFHDVEKLKTAKQVSDALIVERDRQRGEILEVVKELRDNFKDHKREVKEDFKDVRTEIEYLRRENHKEHT